MDSSDEDDILPTWFFSSPRSRGWVVETIADAIENRSRAMAKLCAQTARLDAVEIRLRTLQREQKKLLRTLAESEKQHKLACNDVHRFTSKLSFTQEDLRVCIFMRRMAKFIDRGVPDVLGRIFSMLPLEVNISIAALCPDLYRESGVEGAILETLRARKGWTEPFLQLKAKYTYLVRGSEAITAMGWAKSWNSMMLSAKVTDIPRELYEKDETKYEDVGFVTERLLAHFRGVLKIVKVYPPVEMYPNFPHQMEQAPWGAERGSYENVEVTLRANALCAFWERYRAVIGLKCTWNELLQMKTVYYYVLNCSDFDIFLKSVMLQFSPEDRDTLKMDCNVKKRGFMRWVWREMRKYSVLRERRGNRANPRFF